MYKLQSKNREGRWGDIVHTRIKGKPPLVFETRGKAIEWRMVHLGIGSRSWTRIIEIKDRGGGFYVHE